MDILVVDDYEKVGQMLKTILREHGHDVDFVLNGQDALDKIKGKHYDAIFLDIVMPGMDGLATLREIRQINAQVKVVMISGYSLEDIYAKAKQYNVHAFLHKPIDTQQLLNAIR